MPGATQQQLESVFRAEHARVVASLARRFADVDLAEEATADALLAAVQNWRAHGIPPNPGGWLTTTATRRALDRLRRESTRPAREAHARLLVDDDPPQPTSPVADDRLRLVFTCCHPALAAEARVALTLRLVGGLTTAEIAQAFLVPEPTMAQRLTRAKRKIAAARIPFRLPQAADVPARLAGALATLYLVFNEGYLPSGGTEPSRPQLCHEAIRLARLLAQLLPEEPETEGLLALLLLTHARADARFEQGVLVPLREQDRGRWDASMIAEGHDIVRRCLRRDRPGPYQIQAAVNAVHTDAATFELTDWGQIVQLYDQLLALTATPVVRLNRAVALAELDGPAVALGEVESLGLHRYHAWHATRADLLRRMSRPDPARAAYDAAISLAGNPAERAYLVRRRDDLDG